MGLSKQCRPKSDCSYRRSLIRVCTICLSVCIFGWHYCIVKQKCSIFTTVTVIIIGPGCSKLTTSKLTMLLVNISLKFQMFYI